MDIRAERKWFLAIPIILALLCLAVPVHAANVTVSCPGGSAGTYPSITTALSAIGVIGPSTITVTGTCNETVGLFNARSITIVAGAGGATIIGMQGNDAFDISLSQDITLGNLEIRGNAASSSGGGVVIFENSQVNIVGCNIHDNPDFGVLVNRDSQAFLRNTTIQNNPGDALDVHDDSSADVAGTTIQNNGFGVDVATRSGVIFRQHNLILNNGDFGIFATDSCRVGVLTADPAFFTTISGHNVNGIGAGDQTIVRMEGPHAIQGNGSACPTDPTCGGIFAIRNATLNLSSANISGNQGSGIAVEQLADVLLDNTTVSNNTGDGVHIRRISVAQFIAANTVTGNGGASVSCDTTSLVVGDLSTFSNIACKQIERPHGPPRPGKPKQPEP